MKYVDTSTVGKRIRISRQKLNLNLGEMAEKIGVSPNYVSAIERNVKKPSDNLLVKIAELAEVSVDWLKNGDVQNSDTESEKTSSSQFAGSMESRSASLLLNLILREDPAISKAIIATVLAVDEKTVDKILDEPQNIEYDPAWETGFFSLAQRLELPDVLKPLRGVVSFLEGVESRKTDYALIRSLGKVLSEKFQDKFTCVSHATGAYTDGQSNSAAGRHFVFQQETTQDMWQVNLYSAMHGSLLEERLFRAIDPRDSTNGNTALVFNDEDTFNELFAVKERVFQRVEGSLKNKRHIVLMRIDPDSMSVIDKVYDTVIGGQAGHES